MNTGRGILFAGILAALLLIGLEAFFHVAFWVFPSVEKRLCGETETIENTVADSILGHRPNPAHPEHDARGFRNPHVPARADVLCLGDSQTYGTGVSPHQAWPHQLGKLAGVPTYSMAFGGYGPTHSLALMDEGLELAPRLVLFAFYAGNDLYDAFNHVYYQNQFSELRAGDSVSKSILDSLEEAGELKIRIERIFNMDRPERMGVQRKTAKGLLPRFSKTYVVIRAGKWLAARRLREIRNRSTRWDKAKRYANRYAGYCEIFEGKDARTIFTSRLRLAALDQRDDRLKEGLRLSLVAMASMRDRAAEKGIRFGVLLIPTKESVFAPFVEDPKTGLREEFNDLVVQERRVWNATKQFLMQNGISFVDVLPALQQCISEGSSPYDVTYDGHPNALGQRHIARAAMAQFFAGSDSIPSSPSMVR